MDQPLESIYVISVAAQLAGMHPQTLRQYDRLGLVRPQRTKGRGRRYSRSDVADLREVQRLSQEEGINLAGIKRIMSMRKRIAKLEAENRRLKDSLRRLEEHHARVFKAGPGGEVALNTSPRKRYVSSQAIIRYSPSQQVILWGNRK